MHWSMAKKERLYQRHEYDVIITSVWQKPFVELSMAEPLVGLLLQTRGQDESALFTKLAYIRNEDPYVLNTSDLCKDVSCLPALG